jgi:hypothetical protein
MPSRVAFLVMLAALARWGLAYDILATTVITHTVWTTCLCHETAMTTAYSTCIDLGAATLTGVTIKPVSSPSTCYQFPTPLTALMPVALPLHQILDTDATDLVFFYVGDNGIVPKYLGNPVASYTPLLDLSSEASSAGHLAMTLPGKALLVIDGFGVHIFKPGCTTVSSLSIDNFWQQVLNITSIPATISPPSHLRRRATTDEVDFTVWSRSTKGPMLPHHPVQSCSASRHVNSSPPPLGTNPTP